MYYIQCTKTMYCILHTMSVKLYILYSMYYMLKAQCKIPYFTYYV